MITERDKEIVRKLATEHFGHHEFQSGVFPADEAINNKLLESSEIIEATPVPGFESLRGFTLRAVRELFKKMKISPSLAYEKKFHATAMCLGFKNGSASVKVADVALVLQRKFEIGAIAANFR